MQYTITRIPRIEEWHVGYETPSTVVMEPWKTFTSRAIRQPRVQTRLPLMVKSPEVKPKEWVDNGLRVTHASLQ
jgi:hypothetical protein